MSLHWKLKLMLAFCKFGEKGLEGGEGERGRGWTGVVWLSVRPPPPPPPNPHDIKTCCVLSSCLARITHVALLPIVLADMSRLLQDSWCGQPTGASSRDNRLLQDHSGDHVCWKLWEGVCLLPAESVTARHLCDAHHSARQPGHSH